jgi:hypothetical protein
MTETPQNPPPGFYPDGQGVLRYWDGLQWTEQVQSPTVSPVMDRAPASRSDRPWFKKKRVIIPAALVAMLFIGGVAGGGGTDDDKDGTTASATKTNAEPADAADADDVKKAADEPTVAAAPEVAATTKAPAKPKPTKKPEPELTSGQENALSAAENYLSFAPFSHDGLIQQLSSEYGDGYSKADATYAADHVDVDFKEQAVKAAKNYLDISPFSRAAMIEQLSSEYGDQYTREQAEYGAKKAGL